jgi:thioredoxin reductase (NADPH)
LPVRGAVGMFWPMSQTHRTKLLIIGSGPAGYTAAIYAARANLAPIQVLGLQPGGQLTITSDVENYPGFPEAIQGPWLMDQMKAQAEHVGTTTRYDLITEVDFNQRPFRAVGDSGDVFLADTVVIATGAQARWLGLDSEQRYKGLGVSACATCDGFFFRNKQVAVIGGGNTAVEEALFLTNFATKVTLIHRRASLRAERVMQDRLFNHPKIEVIWNATVDEVLGSAGGTTSEGGAVTGLRLTDVPTGASREIHAEGVFVAIGHDPATSLFRGQLDMDSEGYIRTAPDSTATSVPGVFAAGDVKDKVFRQAVTAAGMGCMAAIEADKWLALHESHGSHAAAAE